MRIGVSIFLIALGAVLRFALETSIDGINLAVTGVILMIVGIVGLVLSLALWSSLSPVRRQARIADTEVVRDVQTVATNEPELL